MAELSELNTLTPQKMTVSSIFLVKVSRVRWGIALFAWRSLEISLTFP